MFHYFKKQIAKRSNKVVEEREKELQKEKESGNLSEDNQNFTSSSMLAVGATVTVTSDPDSSGSEQNSEEEFIWLPMPPQFVQGHLEYLEDVLMGPDFPTADLNDASEDNSSDDSGSDHSNESNKNHDSSNDSDNHSHNDHGNEVYNNDYVILQQEEMQTGDFHLHILQSKLEDNSTKVVEGSRKPIEGKEKQEEEHKEGKTTSQWKHPEASPSGSTLADGVTMSPSRDPERGAAIEQSSDEEIFEVQNSLSLIPSRALVEKMEPKPSPRYRSYFCFFPFCW